MDRKLAYATMDGPEQCAKNVRTKQNKKQQKTTKNNKKQQKTTKNKKQKQKTKTNKNKQQTFNTPHTIDTSSHIIDISHLSHSNYLDKN